MSAAYVLITTFTIPSSSGSGSRACEDPSATTVRSVSSVLGVPSPYESVPSPRTEIDNASPTSCTEVALEVVCQVLT